MPGRPSLSRRPVRALLVAAALVLVAGAVGLGWLVFGHDREVAVTAPTPDARTAAACAALAATLPETVAGQPRRTVTPATPTTAAWGDPPIVLRCGVPRPAGLEPTSILAEVDGVGWFPERLSAGTLFTSHGRQAYVEVAIPEAYEPASVLTDLAPALLALAPAEPAAAG